MKTKIYLPIRPSFKIMVEEGEKINSKTVIGQIPSEQNKEVIPISKILSVNPSAIPKYLKKNIGSAIRKGEVIAAKKGFLSASSVKSPLSGKITEMDLKKGTLTILAETGDIQEDITCPVPGKIKDIKKTQIEIEVEGEVYQGISGGGKDATGILKFIDSNFPGVLDISFEVENGIIACKCISEDVVAKLDVLGAHGLIGNRLPQITNLPWVQAEESVLEELSAHNNQNVWLRPIHKEIIVYN